MKNPFPDMDPYIEGFWGDVHTSLLYLANELGRYETLDYASSCDPPLSRKDVFWANEVFRKAGKR